MRVELPVTAARPRLYHVRQQQGRFAVDLLAELAGDGLVAMEVKATASPGPADARHLAALRDCYPDRFVAGVVLHTGPRTLVLGERLLAAPIFALWAAADDMRT